MGAEAGNTQSLHEQILHKYLTASSALSGGFFNCVLYIICMIYDSQTILLAVIGLIGVLATGVIVTYSFTRNRTGNGRYQ